MEADLDQSLVLDRPFALFTDARRRHAADGDHLPTLAGTVTTG